MSIIGYNNSLSIKNLEIWQILVKLGILSMQALGSKGTDENRKKSEEFKDLKMELEAFKEKQFEGRKAFLASDKDTSGDDKSTTSPVEFQTGYVPDQEIQ